MRGAFGGRCAGKGFDDIDFGKDICKEAVI